MHQLNRRKFFQILGAAGLAPALPAMATRAAASGATTPAQMLWASLYAQAGSGTQFIDLARKIGIAPNAAQGIYGKMVGSRVLAAQGGRSLARVARPAPAVVHTEPAVKSVNPRLLKDNLNKILGVDSVEEAEGDEPDTAPIAKAVETEDKN